MSPRKETGFDNRITLILYPDLNSKTMSSPRHTMRAVEKEKEEEEEEEEVEEE